jgi:hypothetical protein
MIIKETLLGREKNAKMLKCSAEAPRQHRVGPLMCGAQRRKSGSFGRVDLNQVLAREEMFPLREGGIF